MAAKKKVRVIEAKEEEEKWVKHYCSNHQMLLVGEGDFSFSLSLALSFGFASNVVATSLDSYGDVIKKYKKAKSNLENLEKLGASILHGVDATKMKLHSDLKMCQFDRIIFNFPHAGFYGREDNVHMIEMHRNLVRGFLGNANGMLRAGGEIHVTHKTTTPFCHWNIEGLAWINSLELIEHVEFKIEDYPGYNNKRGNGFRSDESFPLGKCSTFKFIISPDAKKMSKVTSQLSFTQKLYQEHRDNPIQMWHQLTSFDHGHPQTSLTTNMNDFLGHRHLPLAVSIRRESDEIFERYFSQRHLIEARARSQQLQGKEMKLQHQSASFNPKLSQTSFTIDTSDSPAYLPLPLTFSIRGESAKAFNGYFNHGLGVHGGAVNHVDFSTFGAQRHNSEIYMTEAHGRNLHGDLNELRELQHLNNLRAAELRRMLLIYGQHPEGMRRS